jgi:hypothetical protein
MQQPDIYAAGTHARSQQVGMNLLLLLLLQVPVCAGPD